MSSVFDFNDGPGMISNQKFLRLGQAIPAGITAFEFFSDGKRRRVLRRALRGLGSEDDVDPTVRMTQTVANSTSAAAELVANGTAAVKDMIENATSAIYESKEMIENATSTIYGSVENTTSPEPLYPKFNLTDLVGTIGRKKGDSSSSSDVTDILTSEGMLFAVISAVTLYLAYSNYKFGKGGGDFKRTAQLGAVADVVLLALFLLGEIKTKDLLLVAFISTLISTLFSYNIYKQYA